ncbi:MAG: ATP-binding protein [Gemmatimonadales bacterium]
MTGAATQELDQQDAQDQLISQRRYRKIMVAVVLSVSVVAVLPLVIMTGIADHQYQQAFRTEATQKMVRFAANGKQSLESFVSEHLSALNMVVRGRPVEELQDPRRLNRVLTNLKQSFGGFVDLGVIDADGIQVSYAGPYELEGRGYAGHEWFDEVSVRGSHVSDVFMGYRNVPHFVIAVRQDLGAGDWFVLRATIGTDIIDQLVQSLVVEPGSDAFILNREGVLQTPSGYYGAVLQDSPLPPFAPSSEIELVELEDESGQSLIASYGQVSGSPFTLVLLSPESGVHAALRRDLLFILGISVLFLLALVFGGSVYMVNRVREADLRRAAVYHKMEYTNKMAALGRLSAGVAHEINNPLSIITEKAGLLKDHLMLSEKLPPREKLIGLVNSVLNSAERCGGITHRLLGFAKHMEVQRETIDLDVLIKEVLGFLEKEAVYRDIHVDFNIPEDPPTLTSDRGQLQQVFLNIVNNAFAAVDEGGHIEIGIERAGDDTVAVSVTDDGGGIPEEHLSHIFDPFFTTKKAGGTGLGLSITYGIVQKLGGQISVRSRVGEGTCFTVTLPVSKPSG